MATQSNAVQFDWAPVMRAAFDAARRGPKLAVPQRGVNPQVGCVLVDGRGEIVATGTHRGVGTPHAEVDALSQLAAQQRTPGEISKLSAVVSLEPCNHTGHTGPCAEALIAAGISRVVYSVDDPGQHSGGGAERLRAAGVEVIGGVLRDEGETLLGSWLVAARLGRPFVTVKWGQSLDGRAAANDGTSQWITGEAARADVHFERSRFDGIAVGSGTALADNPALTARTPNGLYDEQPIPVVFGRREIPADAALRHGPHQPIFLPGTELGAELASLPGRGIRTLLIEGGPTLASSMIRDGFADELLVYQAPVLLGGERTALAGLGIDTLSQASHWRFDQIEQLGPDLKLRARRAKEEH